MKTRKVWLFSAHLLPLLARFFAVSHATLLAVNTFSMGLTGAGATVFLLSHLFLPYRLARAAYSELVHMEVLFSGEALLFSWERLDSAHVYFRFSLMHLLHLLVFSGVWVVQASCSWNLSVEPICRPSALQRLLVCSVHCAAMLRHHEWKCLIRPSGNYVLPAHKVQWNVEESTCLWVFLFFFLRPPIDFFPLLSRPVSLSVVPLHTLFWAWPSWFPILLSDCSTYASSTWEAMQLFRMKMSCTGEIITLLTYHRFTPLCPIPCLILSHNSFVHVLEGNSHNKNPKATFHLWGRN